MTERRSLGALCENGGGPPPESGGRGHPGWGVGIATAERLDDNITPPAAGGLGARADDGRCRRRAMGGRSAPAPLARSHWER
eukprot:852296-Pyramimonas_sp.AAC.1